MSRKGTIDVFQNKITRNDRFAQMSHQEQVIEQKKREIQAKIEQKQKAPPPVTSNVTVAARTIEKTPKIGPKLPVTQPMFNFNAFSNDGSFLDQFKQLKEKKPESKSRIFMKNREKDRKPNEASAGGKSSRWSGSKDTKRVSRFSERPVSQSISISTTYSNLISKNNFDTPPIATPAMSPQAVIGQPLLHKTNLPITTPHVTTHQPITTPVQIIHQPVISTQQLMHAPMITQQLIHAPISNESHPLLLSVPPPQVLEPPPTLGVEVGGVLGVGPPLPPPPLPLQQLPTLELSSIPPPNPIQIHNIPQPEPMNTLSIPPPAPLQVQNIPPPSPLQLTEIPNPKPLDLLNIPTPTEGGGGGGTHHTQQHPTDYITSVPPPNKCILPPPPHLSNNQGQGANSCAMINVMSDSASDFAQGYNDVDFGKAYNDSDFSKAYNDGDYSAAISGGVNVSMPPPQALHGKNGGVKPVTSVSSGMCMQQHPPPNVNIPPPMKPQTHSIQQQVMLPPPSSSMGRASPKVHLRPPPSTTPPPPPQNVTTPASIPALMAHPILPPSLSHNAAGGVSSNSGSVMAQVAPPPPLNMTCPPPLVDYAPPTLMAAQKQQLQQQQQVQISSGCDMTVMPPMGAVQAVTMPTVGSTRNMSTVFTAGTVEFEAMAQLARVVARCGNSVQEVLLQRKPRDPDLWFLLQPHDSLIYRQYQQLVDQFRLELRGGADTLTTVKLENYRPEDIYDPDDAIAEEEEALKLENQEMFMLGMDGIKMEQGDSSGSSSAQETAEERRKRKRKSRWGEHKLHPTSPPTVCQPMELSTSPSITLPSNIAPVQAPNNSVLLSKLTRTDPALLQYAQQTFGSTNLTEEDWKKAEDHYKINLLYQDMLRRRQEVERLQKAGKFKYDYDSDEEVDEGGTWEHKLREKEMTATNLWAAELTKQAEGKHHIGDFLPPEEFKKFMEKSQAVIEGRTPNISDYKEFKLKEDNVGFKMLQKLGWSEGQGLGADGSGIVDPVNKSSQRDLNQGLGVGDEQFVTTNDDEYDAYRKRMMLAYRFRPNPLNNPRRPYY